MKFHDFLFLLFNAFNILHIHDIRPVAVEKVKKGNRNDRRVNYLSQREENNKTAGSDKESVKSAYAV